MATPSRIDRERAFAKRAGKTGAARRARESSGHTVATASTKLGVDGGTYSRWERALTTPTHHDHLARYVRWLKRLGVENDPAMREDGFESAEAEGRELECA
jgi:transcriptional regulator with XRE-family HTH domain